MHNVILKYVPGGVFGINSVCVIRGFGCVVDEESTECAVACITVYVFIVVRVAFGFALLVTPFLPLTTVLVADYISERRSS